MMLSSIILQNELLFKSLNPFLSTFFLMWCVVNYGDQLERLMKSVLLVTRIAVLARKVAKNQLSKSQDRQLRETSSSLDSPEGSTSSFSELQAEDFYSGEDQEGMLSVLEEWDEPELVQERLLQVSNGIKLWFSFFSFVRKGSQSP